MCDIKRRFPMKRQLDTRKLSQIAPVFVIFACWLPLNGLFGCAAIDNSFAESDSDVPIQEDGGRKTVSESDTNDGDSESEAASDSDWNMETDTPEDETSSDTETETEEDTGSFFDPCPTYSKGWPCSCRKLIVGCDDGSECIGVTGLFDQVTGFCAKSCTPETGLSDCQSPYSAVGDCGISNEDESRFYCVLYCENNSNCPPGQTCQPLGPASLYHICHP